MNVPSPTDARANHDAPTRLAAERRPLPLTANSNLVHLDHYCANLLYLNMAGLPKSRPKGIIPSTSDLKAQADSVVLIETYEQGQTHRSPVTEELGRNYISNNYKNDEENAPVKPSKSVQQESLKFL
jgi:hypothetical protein